MTNLRRLLSAPFLTLLLTGCTAAAPQTVDLEPMNATPAKMPLEWFVEEWGTIPEEILASEESRPVPGRPHLIVDGQHTVRNPGTGLVSELVGLEKEDIRTVVILHCQKGAWLFGGVAGSGVLMVFTHQYDGPMPILRGREVHECQ